MSPKERMSPKEQLMAAASRLYDGVARIEEYRTNHGDWWVQAGPKQHLGWEFAVTHKRRGAARRIMAATLSAALDEEDDPIEMLRKKGFGIA